MVFMGWRIVGGPQNGQVFTRAQVGNIVMNGLVADPANPGETVRNAPTGRINLEAIWHQRLVFTKTGELLYLTNTNTTRIIEPRDGAVFEVDIWNSTLNVWQPFVSSITISGNSGNPVPALGTPAGNPPFAGQVPHSAGIVVTQLPFAAGERYRLREITPPAGYMLPGGYWEIIMAPVGPAGDIRRTDARIQSITPMNQIAYNNVYFFDSNHANASPQQIWHVGNRRPRLTFIKHDRDGNPLDGVRFILERWENNEWVPAPGPTPSPSGTVMERFPGQALSPASVPIPAPAPTPVPGKVAIVQPLRPSQTGQYRLREIGVPDGSGYLIPTGYWLLNTNQFGGVIELVPSPGLTGIQGVGAVPNFGFTRPAANTPNYPWDGVWSVRNTPIRYWPFLKTDENLYTNLPHSYLPGAEFRLFVYTGPGTTPPPLDRFVMPDDIFLGGGDWEHVATRTSYGTRRPMWFPMMPGRHYQLVEVLAPVGYQLPHGQWRITVTGADSASTVAGTGLNSAIVGWDTPAMLRISTAVNCAFVHNNCWHIEYCYCDGGCQIVMYAHHIGNIPLFQLPLAGGTGTMMITLIGVTVVGFGLVLAAFMIMSEKYKPKRIE